MQVSGLEVSRKFPQVWTGGSDKLVCLWDSRGQLLATLADHSSYVKAIVRVRWQSDARTAPAHVRLRLRSHAATHSQARLTDAADRESGHLSF
jgi:hypothetical protein